MKLRRQTNADQQNAEKCRQDNIVRNRIGELQMHSPDGSTNTAQ